MPNDNYHVPLTFDAFDELFRQIPLNGYVEIYTERNETLRGWVPTTQPEKNLRRCEKLNNWCYLRLQTPTTDSATERQLKTYAFAVDTVETIVWR